MLAISGKLEAATTQTLKLELEPVVKTENGTYTTDFAVADQTEEEQRFGPGEDTADGHTNRPEVSD